MFQPLAQAPRLAAFAGAHCLNCAAPEASPDAVLCCEVSGQEGQSIR